MSAPSEDRLIFAAIVLIEAAESRDGREAEWLREVTDYVLRMSSLRPVSPKGSEPKISHP